VVVTPLVVVELIVVEYQVTVTLDVSIGHLPHFGLLASVSGDEELKSVGSDVILVNHI